MRKFFMFLLLAALLAPARPALAVIATPRACLTAITEAVNNRDLESFEKLVDVNGIISNGIDVFIAEMQKPENLGSLNPVLALMFSGLASQGATGPRALLAQELRSFVANGVSSGAFAGKPVASYEAQGMLAPFLSSASMGKKEIRSIGEAIPAGNGWLAPFSVHDYDNGQDYPVIGLFTPAENGLRLTGIENLEQLFQQIRKEILQ